MIYAFGIEKSKKNSNKTYLRSLINGSFCFFDSCLDFRLNGLTGTGKDELISVLFENATDFSLHCEVFQEFYLEKL